MPIRTVLSASYDQYLDEVYPRHDGASAEWRAVVLQSRETWLAIFPHTVLLKVSYPELDFANRWCWQQFGPAQGVCLEYQSNYPGCQIPGSHSHEGTWANEWLAKADYEFGYNEWYFAGSADRERFLSFLPQICWGEKYPDGA